MSDILKTLLQILGILFAILLLGFTGYQTWSLLYEVTGNPIIATLGLVVFEGGMLYWWMYFQKTAEGLPQMALSLGMFLIGLLLVGGATALHLGAVNAATFGADTPAKLITVAVLLNLIAKTFMPILEPETMLKAKQKASQGKITALAFKRLDAKVDDIAEDLADRLAGDMLAELEQAALATRRRPQLIEGKASPKTTDPAAPIPASRVSLPEGQGSLLKGNGRPIHELATPPGPQENEEGRLHENYGAAQRDFITGTYRDMLFNVEQADNAARLDDTRPTSPQRFE